MSALSGGGSKGRAGSSASSEPSAAPMARVRWDDGSGSCFLELPGEASQALVKKRDRMNLVAPMPA